MTGKGVDGSGSAEQDYGMSTNDALLKQVNISA